MVVVGILLTFVMKILVYTTPNSHNVLYDFMITIFITMVVWEGNLHIDEWFHQHLPWVSHTWQRFLSQLGVAMLYSAGLIFILMYLYQQYVCNTAGQHLSLMRNSFLIGLFVSFLLLTIEVSTQFFLNWKKSLLEVEVYKQKHIQATLDNLQSQINPHFLFNNLSVLSSLVYENQDKAVAFIHKLAEVYRYVLDKKNEELVTVQQELAFVEVYLDLIQIRFEHKFTFQIQVAEDIRRTYMPPMCIQMLVENVIQHNEISTRLPMQLQIHVRNGYLHIQNPIQLRKQHESGSKTGLENIKSRYAYFTDLPVNIINGPDYFIVQLPILTT